MRPSILTVALVVSAAPLLAGPAHAAPDAAIRAPPACPASGTVQTSGRPLRLTPLNQLPPGVVVLTVLRRVGDCSVIVVKAGGTTYYVPGGAGRREPLPGGQLQPPR